MIPSIGGLKPQGGVYESVCQDFYTQNIYNLQFIENLIFILTVP